MFKFIIEGIDNEKSKHIEREMVKAIQKLENGVPTDVVASDYESLVQRFITGNRNIANESQSGYSAKGIIVLRQKIEEVACRSVS